MDSLITNLHLKRSFFCISLSFLCTLSVIEARDQPKLITSDFIHVHVNSLIPQNEELACKHSSSTEKKQGVSVSLRVVHRHGSCSKIKSAVIPSHADLLKLDQDRVDSIHARISGQSLAGEEVVLERKSVNLPAQSGASVGSGNYIISVGLGTPQKDISLIFDTGSDLTWTQCKPCAGSCYDQVDPIFDPSSSSSYVNVSCGSSVCNELVSATGRNPRCSVSACVYGIQYGDGSFSVGLFGQERLSLSSTEYIDGYLFGCGENNQGLFTGVAGLIGLGRDRLSLVSQAASKYGKYFSYCLPSGSSSTGHLTLGHGGTKAKRFSYTPLLTSSSTSASNFYFLDLQSISVGGTRLPIPATVFSDAGSLIDSGTVISRLPPKAYSALSSAFKKYMSDYPAAPALSILDTCFNLTDYQSISVPKVTLYFRGGGVLDLPLKGILYASKISQVCLGFAGNSDDTDVTILGNVQQQGFDVVYNVDGGKIGFGANGC